VQGSHASWKVMEFKKEFCRPGKSWEMTVVVESAGKAMTTVIWNSTVMGHGIF